MSLVLPLAFGSLFVLGFCAVNSRRRLKELQFVLARDESDDEKIYNAYFAGSGLPREAVREVWHEVAAALRLPASRMKPTDRFGKDIGTWLITSDELDLLAQLGTRRAKRLGFRPKFELMATVDDYIRALAQMPGE